ncbi:ornithine decarboxylase [Meinhardsimonia xiamenensis]|jgi:ornithine decarboxylase|uniref:ornithine decarboxylase n=1 Tax=Meinhardsimonia xiamenensis TaxID=990712 RepID=A0A1G9F7M4_9RHOB|nr:type III PLP-dependent enzyme [Meinhardsimonia xiamenensis]PRX37957.1 ornithine decarboxylase [Meinhardsimonia xiamenensis]SDK84335.1 ornithine decarboxylase [Meinhardsimonia xiamenensis]
MTTLPEGARAPRFACLTRAERFIAGSRFERPTLVIDTEAVAARYRALAAGLGRAAIHYAVKANPHPAILARLAAEGCRFDAASRAEIESCIAAGARGADISFGNTIKRPADIAFAHAAGVRLFAADAEEEIDKIAAHAPGASVYIRLAVASSEADWPLSRKFGCAPETALALLDRARALGLEPAGLSFHVGSQTRAPSMWRPVLDQVAAVWAAARAAGHDLRLLNIGGGFPAAYDSAVPAPRTYAEGVMAQVDARFPDAREIMAEPGRGLVAEAGAIGAEVLLVARKSPMDLHRWVYLDIGRFSGLAECEGEAIRYPILTEKDGEATGPCILAGPSCDSADVLYERRPVMLPLSLAAGDRVIIRNAGAYTSTYASVGFNGFPPLEVVAI